MKRFLCSVSVVLLVALAFFSAMSFAATYPNIGGFVENDHIDRYGYVQIQPSHLDAGRHAWQGRVRLIIIDRDGNVTYTGYSYTESAYDFDDDTIYRAESHHITAVWNDVSAQYAFYWNTTHSWSPDNAELTE